MRPAGRLDGLIPRGRTPISDSLRLAGEKLAGIEDDTTIVLVSDGIETCKGDPCAVAEALARSSAKLKIHVVGYAVDGKARAQLQCVADKGRGRYFTADDTSSLTTALTTVTESIRTAQPIEVEPPKADDTATLIKVSITGPGRIRLKVGTWTQAPNYWKVLNPETGEVVATTTKSEVEVMPGQYQIAWRHLEHGSKEVALPQVIVVEAGKVSEAVVATGLQLMPPKGIDRPYYWQLLPEGADIEKDYRQRQAAAWYWVWDPVPVPAGNYTLVMRQSEHGHEEAVVANMALAEGSFTQVPLDRGINLQWPEAWGKIEYLKVTDASGRVARMKHRGPLFLAPGRYKLALRLTQHGHGEASFGEVVVPEKGYADARLTSGIAFETASKGEFTVYAVNLDTREEAVMRNRWGPMPLGAGRYRFDLQLRNGKRETIVPELTIAPGQFVTAKM